jgi:hypothetical protein
VGESSKVAENGDYPMRGYAPAQWNELLILNPPQQFFVDNIAGLSKMTP